jgi:hypothetical protein
MESGMGTLRNLCIVLHLVVVRTSPVNIGTYRCYPARRRQYDKVRDSSSTEHSLLSSLWGYEMFVMINRSCQVYVGIYTVAYASG